MNSLDMSKVTARNKALNAVTIIILSVALLAAGLGYGYSLAIRSLNIQAKSLENRYNFLAEELNKKMSTVDSVHASMLGDLDTLRINTKKNLDLVNENNRLLLENQVLIRIYGR